MGHALDRGIILHSARLYAQAAAEFRRELSEFPDSQPTRVLLALTRDAGV